MTMQKFVKTYVGKALTILNDAKAHSNYSIVIDREMFERLATYLEAVVDVMEDTEE